MVIIRYQLIPMIYKESCLHVAMDIASIQLYHLALRMHQLIFSIR